MSLDQSDAFGSIATLGRLIRSGSVSIVDLTQAFLARIETHDPVLGAYLQVCSQQALSRAQQLQDLLSAGTDLGPLHGIPYAAKDLFAVAGLPTTAGTHLLADNIAAADAPVIQKLSECGMILLGKTNTVQFAYSGIGINHDHGTPHNPWQRTAHIPGGSSSGSAVAVASGMAAMALGTDTGGSVRIPAALCGITGLKPTVGRVSRTGVYPLSWNLDSVGPLTRSVEDAAWVYAAICGAEKNDDTTHNVPAADTLTRLKDGVKGMRLAFVENVFWDDCDAEVAAAVRSGGAVFEQLGATVARISLDEVDAAWALNRQGLIVVAEAYANNRDFLDNHFDDLDPIVANRIVNGRDISAADYLENTRRWRELRIRVIEAMADFDALIVPTTCIPAQPLDKVDTQFDEYARFNALYLRNTSIGNILNWSGLSLPCGFTAKGLPIGLMLYSKPFAEDLLLRIGYAFQQATDWHLRTPDLSWTTHN